MAKSCMIHDEDRLSRPTESMPNVDMLANELPVPEYARDCKCREMAQDTFINQLPGACWSWLMAGGTPGWIFIQLPVH